MKNTIYNLMILIIISLALGSCRPPVDNANPSGDGIEQEWKEDNGNNKTEEGNDTIIHPNTEKNSKNGRDRSVTP